MRATSARVLQLTPQSGKDVGDALVGAQLPHKVLVRNLQCTIVGLAKHDRLRNADDSQQIPI